MPARRNIAPEVATARAYLAGLTARHASESDIDAARAALAEANARAAIRRWQLGPAARTRLAILLLGGDDVAA
jgi:hypothetical protein